MAYQELGEARILKRYGKEDLLKPARASVMPSKCGDNWQSLEQASIRFLQNVKRPCVTSG